MRLRAAAYAAAFLLYFLRVLRIINTYLSVRRCYLLLDYKKFLDKQMLREKFLDKQNFVKKLFDGNLLYQRIAIGCAAVLVLLLFTIALGGNPAGSPAASPGKVLYVQVKSGMTAGEIGDALQQKGVISSKYRFWLLAKLNGAESSFKAGNYAFHSQMEPRDVLGMLCRARLWLCGLRYPRDIM